MSGALVQYSPHSYTFLRAYFGPLCPLKERTVAQGWITERSARIAVQTQYRRTVLPVRILLFLLVYQLLYKTQWNRDVLVLKLIISRKGKLVRRNP